MGGQNYYLLASLPSLGEVGSTPPLTPAQLLDRVADAAGPSRLIGALLLGDDLLLRESVMSDKEMDAQPAVLTAEQLRDEAPLPAMLVAEAEEGVSRIAADVVWEAYFRYAADVARQAGSTFLSDWVGSEVALRNALAASRAKTLGLDAEAYRVVDDLADRDAEFNAVLGEWAAAPNPLAALRVLDTARWAWLIDREGWFTFQDDELAAYAAKLMLLCRWNRLEAAEREARNAPAAEARTPTE